ncbi:MAG TPA: HepT-like ribonuclease domain-containing protein [Moheibacter sp.]|nr:HepT-like ribonuclease domain-containing protein [Moheibacter sp.]
MNERVLKYLYDISNSIGLIEEFMSDIKSFDQYVNDLKTKNAVERQLAIIGEALNKVLKEEPEIKISDSKDIINFRNRLVHAYDSIDDTIIWAIKTKHLPVLKNEILNLLD